MSANSTDASQPELPLGLVPNRPEKPDFSDRHPSVQEVVEWFEYDHLTNQTLKLLSEACHDLAVDMVDKLGDHPQLTKGLQHLLEAKDCFVRAGVAELRKAKIYE